jgi:flagellar basal body-associated protein FliL
MSPIKSILVIATVFSCLFSSISSTALSSTSSSTSSNSTSQPPQTSSVSSTISSQQIELADKLPNGKKLLKKPLSLDYTNPKFETEITQSQRDAILKTLKKWKGELPVNNNSII